MQEQEISPELSAAIKREVKEAMNEWTRESLFTKEHLEIFWATAFDVLQEKAQEHTGKFVFSSLGGLLNKVALFLLIGGLVYAAGGWTALASLAKSLFVSSQLSH